ncbi:MAG: TRAP transporter substrate-binding protein [Reyranellaceae bacterium]
MTMSRRGLGAAALALPFLSRSASAQQVKIKLAHVAPPTSSFQSAAERLAAAVKQLSGGTMEIEIVPGGALGSLVQLWAQLRAGTLDMHLIDIGAMTPMKEARAFTAILMPYVFRDTEHYRHFVQSDLFKEMMGEVEQGAGIKYIGYLGDRPPRALTTSKTPVRKIEDLKGLKIRTPEVAAITEAFKAFGANPTPIKASEIYTALQTGLVDGQENGIIDVVAAGWVEVQKYYMAIDYQQSGIGTWMSGARWKSLTPEQQGWMIEAAKRAGIEGRAAYEKELSDAIAVAKGKGMEFIDTDKSGFIKAARPMVAEKDGTAWPKGLVARIEAIK